MSENDNQPGALVDSATVTRLYYVEGKTKSEIARMLSFSRFRVARILERALEDGFVRIEFNYPPSGIDITLSSALQSHLGLEHCLVVPSEEGDRELLMRDLGAAAASLLTEITTAEDVLGFAWSRAMEAMIPNLPELPVKAVVQLCGVYPGAGTEPTALDLVREIGRKAHGHAFTYYAPLIATDPSAAEAIRRQLDYQAASSMYSQVTTAVVGIGAWAFKQSQSTVVDSLSHDEVEKARAQGVVAELCGGVHVGRQGEAIRTDISDRSIGIDASHLEAIPSVIGVVFGAERAEAVRAAVRGKFVNTIVTHSSLAKALLDMPA